MFPCGAPHQRPRIGLTVHYVSHGTPPREDGSQKFPPACRAAIVTEVDTTDLGRLGLNVQNPMGVFHHPLDAGGVEWLPTAAEDFPDKGGTWHFLEECEV